LEAEQIYIEHVSLLRTQIHGMLPGFSCRDLEAVLVKYNEDEAEKIVVMCPAYLPSGSEDLPR
jgi:hypothetical protein